MQAALWYHEKELFGKFGAGDAKAEPADYADAAEKFMAKYNNGDLFYVEKPTPRYIRGEKGSYAAKAPDTGPRFSLPRSNAGSDGRNREGAASNNRPDKPQGLNATGIHFSKQERRTLDSSMFGTGLQGAELDRVMNAEDKRLRHRIYFYVNAGKGISPEFGVGPHAHRAEIENLYDADSDPLNLSVGVDRNGFESRILDAGYDGLITRSFNAAVMIGQRSIDVEYLGMTKPEAPGVGQMPMSDYWSKVKAVNANKSLPGGKMSGADWKRMMPKLMPEIDVSHLDDTESYYKSGLVEKPEVMYSPPRFVSALAQHIEKAPKQVDNGPAAQWKLWITQKLPSLGVKKDEIVWSGVTDWLDTLPAVADVPKDYAGPTQKKVSKEQVSNYLEQGGVKISEVTLGSDNVVTEEDIKDDVVVGGYRVVRSVDKSGYDKWYVLNEDDEQLYKSDYKENVAD
jgi:hypothetical protein